MATNLGHGNKDGKKKKCKYCGYRKKCHLNDGCKSKEKNCFICLKKNHFPKSKNCQVKKKNQRRKPMAKYGCITLRQFLKENHVQLKDMHNILDKNQDWNSGRYQNISTISKEETMNVIQDRIHELEIQIQLR